MAACQLSNNLRDIFVFAKLNYTAYFCGGGCGVSVGEGTHRLLTAATQPPLVTLSVSHSLSLVTVNFSLLPRVPFKNRQQGVNCSDPTSPPSTPFPYSDCLHLLHLVYLQFKLMATIFCCKLSRGRGKNQCKSHTKLR